jgi:hypothetical protein
MRLRHALIAFIVPVTAACSGGGTDERSVLEYCIDRFSHMVDEHPDFYGNKNGPEAACEETIAESGETREAIDGVVFMAETFRKGMEN